MALTRNYMPLPNGMSAIATDDGRMMPVGIPPDALMQQGYTMLPAQPKIAQNMSVGPDVGPLQSRLDAPPPMAPPPPMPPSFPGAGGAGPGNSPPVPWNAGGRPPAAGGAPPVAGGAIGKPGPTPPEPVLPKEVAEPGATSAALRAGGPPIAGGGAGASPGQPEGVTVSLPSNRVVGYTKGGKQVKTGSKEERTELAPGAKERISAATDEQEVAIRNQAAMQAEQQSVLSDAYAAQAAEMRQQAADAQLREQDARLEYDMRQRELDQERQAVENSEVDPKRYFHEKGALVTIGLAIARAMGAYGSAITKTPNDAAKIIDDGIEADIQAQRESIARRQQGIAARQTLLERWMDRNDPETAAEKARVLMRDATAKRIEGEVARIGSEQARVNGEVLIANLKAENTKSLENIQKIDVAESYAYTQPRPIMAGGSQQIQVTPEMAEVLKSTPREKWGEVLQTWGKKRAESLAQGPGGGGLNRGGVVAGYNFENRQMLNKAHIALSAEGAVTKQAELYKQKLEEFQKATPGTSEWQAARSAVTTAHMGLVDARASQIAANSGQSPTDSIRQMAMHEVGDDPSSLSLVGKGLRPNTIAQSKKRVDTMLESGTRTLKGNLERWSTASAARGAEEPDAAELERQFESNE